MKALLFATLLMAHCPKPSPPNLSDGGLPAPACSDAGTKAVTADVCPGMKSAAGFACAKCKDVSGCVDTREDVMVYCVHEGDCADPLCGYGGGGQ